MKILLRIFVFFFFFIGTGIVVLWFNRNTLIEMLIEAEANRTQDVLFDGTLEVEEPYLDRNLKLKIDQIHGEWQSSEGAFPIEVNDIEVQDPVSNFILNKPTRLTFENARPRHSVAPGISGNVILYNNENQKMEIDALLSGLPIEDLRNIDPENLKGASGNLIGTAFLRSNRDEIQELRVDLKVVEPGGQLQARFFDLLLPYLPASDKVVLQRIDGTEIVDYEAADLQVELVGPGRVKVFLNIQVPDYNLDLNLNVTLRVEEQEVLQQLAQVMGLIKVQL